VSTMYNRIIGNGVSLPLRAVEIDRIVELCRERPSTLRELSDRSGLSYQRIRRILRIAEEQKRVRAIDPEGRKARRFSAMSALEEECGTKTNQENISRNF
jgi:predicted transcriptional regulator